MTNDENDNRTYADMTPAEQKAQIAKLRLRFLAAREQHKALSAYFAEWKTRCENESAAIRNRYPAPYSPETGA